MGKATWASALGAALALGCGTARNPENSGNGCGRASAPVTVSNELGTLYGTLETPAKCPPFPVVLIIAGSGPTDRNCNGGSALRTDAFRLLASALADRGVASVRYDKRGVGESARAASVDESAARIEQFVDDAARWLALMRSDARFDRVVVAGHSEGALIGLMLPQTQTMDAFVSLAGAGRPLADVLREQLSRRFSPGVMASVEAVIAELEQGRTVADIPPELASLSELASLFRSSVQPFLISVLSRNPVELIATLEGPALIVQGTTDLQLGVRDAELLAAAKPDAEVALISDMNHVLKRATSETPSQQAAYTDPSVPLADGLVDEVEVFARAAHSVAGSN